jgi:hypothetical protein
LRLKLQILSLTEDGYRKRCDVKAGDVFAVKAGESILLTA